jgi:hypothetical protein
VTTRGNQVDHLLFPLNPRMNREAKHIYRSSVQASVGLVIQVLAQFRLGLRIEISFKRLDKRHVAIS